MKTLSLLKKIAFFPVAIAGAVIVTLLTRAFLLTRPPPVERCQRQDSDYIHLTPEMVNRFTAAIRMPTVAHSQHNVDTDQILRLHEHILQSFPVIHGSSIVKREVINSHSLLYSVSGTDTGLKPFLLAAHMDVVPADNGTWSYPPFEAQVDDGYIYGRGTLDDKQCVVGILEALEYLLKSGFKPKRSFYIAFGHDEEVNGLDGARFITQRLSDRGVELEFVLDEGLAVLNGLINGISVPAAVIGIAEKGYLTVELSVEGAPGHSSMPPAETPIGILAHALSKLQSNPHPSRFGQGPEASTFVHLAPYASPVYRLIFANLWLFAPLMSMVLSRVPAKNAMVRTTTAITLIRGGVKENVIPSSAEAIVNHRIHPSETVQQVLDFDRAIINDDRIKLNVKSSDEPSAISPTDPSIFGYNVLSRSIREVFYDAVVVPGVTVGNTDCRWYGRLSKCVYRFSPSMLFPDDPQRIHGNDERISITNYGQVINFFYHLIRNADKEKEQINSYHNEGEL